MARELDLAYVLAYRYDVDPDRYKRPDQERRARDKERRERTDEAIAYLKAVLKLELIDEDGRVAAYQVIRP